MICDQELELETSDIYFITGLSQRGDRVNLYGSRTIGASVTVLLAEHCLEALKSNSGKIEIMIVWDITLRVLLLTINRVTGAQVHETKNSKFQYAINYTMPTILNWAKAMKINMKRQLSKAKVGKLKQFFYRSVLVTFFLERVPLFHYQLAEVELPLPRDPRMVRWSALMPRITEGQQMFYKFAFFLWLRQQLIIVEDWPYCRTNFHGDPDMLLPEGEDYDGGKKQTNLIFDYFLDICVHDILIL